MSNTLREEALAIAWAIYFDFPASLEQSKRWAIRNIEQGDDFIADLTEIVDFKDKLDAIEALSNIFQNANSENSIKILIALFFEGEELEQVDFDYGNALFSLFHISSAEGADTFLPRLPSDLLKLISEVKKKEWTGEGDGNYIKSTAAHQILTQIFNKFIRQKN